VRMAADRAHKVTAVVRNGTRYKAPAGVRLIHGDVLDAGFVASAIVNHDAVMSGLGMRYKHPFARRQPPDDSTSQATQNILTGMKAARVHRISVISAAGVGDSRPGLNWMMRVMLIISNVGKAYADLERVERLLFASGLDWQAVRPTTLTHKPMSGRVRISDRYRVTDSIPREDVSAFILSELERPEFSARTPLITGD